MDAMALGLAKWLPWCVLSRQELITQPAQSLVGGELPAAPLRLDSRTRCAGWRQRPRRRCPCRQTIAGRELSCFPWATRLLSESCEKRVAALCAVCLHSRPGPAHVLGRSLCSFCDTTGASRAHNFIAGLSRFSTARQLTPATSQVQAGHVV